MIWLLKLYPREWRDRYGKEVEDLVAAQPKSLKLAIDLLGGAIDAHWKPQSIVQRSNEAPAIEEGGDEMISRLRSCSGTVQLSRRDSLISAGLTIGGSMIVAMLLVVWDDPMVEAVLLTMLPGVWLLAIQPFYLRGHSTVSKVVLIGGPLLVLFAIGVVTAVLAVLNAD